MCGIFYIKSKNINNITSWNEIMESFYTLQSRGPDRSEFRVTNSQVLGFHRLAINGTSIYGDQPFCINVNNKRKICLIINGEIYNHRFLSEKHSLPNYSGCDCEILLHLYYKYGLARSISMLDGVFAFVLVDNDDVYIGRDAIGVRPLYYREKENDTIIASSISLGLNKFRNVSKTQQVPAGSYYHFNKYHKTLITWYHIPRPLKNVDNIREKIKFNLVEAVKKRLLSERPLGCLLSGGLDSSLIASILSELLTDKLKTFSIGFSKNATDIIAARNVSKFLNTDHTEVIVSMEDAFESIPEVIKMIGSYDITTVRASVGMYLLCQWISKNTDIKVIFSGEGSDELFCGYLYFHDAPTNKLLEDDSRRLVKELPFFDVLRADRTVSCHGLELRVPFLDKKVIQTALSIPGGIRHPNNKIEKFILRSAFDDDIPCIPHDILWRRKEGFSDGVGTIDNPWYLVIKNHVEDIISEDDLITAKKMGLPDPVTKESVYYFKIYNDYYSNNTEPPIPHHWMPKWQNTNDPSGRVIKAFTK